MCVTRDVQVPGNFTNTLAAGISKTGSVSTVKQGTVLRADLSCKAYVEAQPVRRSSKLSAMKLGI